MFKKHTAIALIAATCFFISGCDENKEKAIQIAQEDIKPFLDDPDAAQFKDIKVVDLTKGAYMVCGTIESKDKRGNDYRNEFASFVYKLDKKNKDEAGSVPWPRYSFIDGLVSKEYYINKTACTEGAEAYDKKMAEFKKQAG
ncbi:TPA: hypothetical protein ACHOZC_003422 [Raoultella ornithinolytica]